MAYATLDDLKTRVGAIYAQLTDLSGGTTAEDTVGQARLVDAHGKVNVLLAARFKTPVDVSADATLAETLLSIVVSFAAWECYVKHPVKSGKMRAAVEADYREAKDMLLRIADGRASLPGLVPLESSVSSGSAAIVVGSPRVIGGDSLAGLG